MRRKLRRRRGGGIRWSLGDNIIHPPTCWLEVFGWTPIREENFSCTPPFMWYGLGLDRGLPRPQILWRSLS